MGFIKPGCTFLKEIHVDGIQNVGAIVVMLLDRWQMLTNPDLQGRGASTCYSNISLSLPLSLEFFLPTTLYLSVVYVYSPRFPMDICNHRAIHV